MLRLTRFFVYACLLTPLVTIWAFYYPFTAPKVFFFVAMSELAMLFYAWLVWQNSMRAPKFSPAIKVFLIFILALVAASIFGIDPSQSFWGSAERDLNMIVLLHLAGLLIVMSGVFQTKQEWERVFVIGVVVGVVVSLMHLFYIAGFSMIDGVKGGSMLGNSSFLGAFLLFPLTFSAYLFFSTSDRIRWLWGLAFFDLIVSLLFSQAQAAIIAFFGGVLFAVAIFFLLERKQRARRVCAGAVIVLLMAGFIFILFGALDSQSAVRAFLDARTSPARFALWEIALNVWQERPVLGWGFENFSSAFFQFYNPCFGTPACGGEFFFDRSHNFFLDTLVFSGLVGLFVFIGFFATLVQNLWKAFRDGSISSKTFVIFIGFLSAYIVQNLTIFDTLSTALFFVVIVAFVGAFASERPVFSTRFLSLPILAILLTVAVPAGLYFFSVQPARAFIATREMSLQTKMSIRARAFEHADTLSPFGLEKRRTFMGAQSAITVWAVDEEQRAVGRQWFEGELSRAQNGLAEMVALHPGLLHSRLVLGLVQLTLARFYSHDSQAARETLSTLVRQNPKFPFSYFGLAMVAINDGAYDEARALSQAAADLSSGVYAMQFRHLLVLKLIGSDVQEVSVFAENLTREFPDHAEKIKAVAEADMEKEINSASFLFNLFYDATL